WTSGRSRRSTPPRLHRPGRRACDRPSTTTARTRGKPRSARLDERRGQAAPGLPGEGSSVGGEGLDADVVGAGVVMFTHPAGGGVLVAPRHQGVDEPVAAGAGQV